MRRLRARYKIVLLLVPLYAVTWIGGYYSHTTALKRETELRYETAKQADANYAVLAAKEGVKPVPPAASPNGPITKVVWCFPVLPGVLIANSYYVVGPLYGRGGVKIVLYYGFGSWATPPIWGWIS